MGWTCAVKTCKNRGKINPKLRFHRFPVGDPFRLNLWLIALKISSIPKAKLKNSFVCEAHFLPEDYAEMKKRAKRHWLKPTAVPSLSTDTPRGAGETVVSTIMMENTLAVLDVEKMWRVPPMCFCSSGGLVSFWFGFRSVPALVQVKLLFLLGLGSVSRYRRRNQAPFFLPKGWYSF